MEVGQDVLILDVTMDNSTGMAVPNGYNYLGKEAVASGFAQWTHFFFFSMLVFSLKEDGKSRWIA